MSKSPAPARWSRASMALHWLSAALIVGLVAVGFVMSDLAASRLHTLSGAGLMLLVLARLVVRWRGARPAPLPLSDLHRRGVGLVHGALYAVLFGIGMSGFATGALSAWPEYLRGELAEAPALEALATRELHEALVFALLGLIALHVGGVFVHELRLGGALRRMLPGGRGEASPGAEP